MVPQSPEPTLMMTVKSQPAGWLHRYHYDPNTQACYRSSGRKYDHLFPR